MIKGIIPEKKYIPTIPIRLQLFADASGGNGGAGDETNIEQNPSASDSIDTSLGGDSIELPKTKEELLKLLGTESEKNVLKAVEDAKAKWEKEFNEKLANEKAEAEKLAKMTAAEKEKHLLEKQKLNIANKEKELIQKEMKLAKIDIFSEKKLPIKLVDFVTGNTAEEVNKNIEAFEKEWRVAIDEAVNERLKGKSPFNVPSNSKNELGIAKQLIEMNKNTNLESLQKARESYFK